MSQPIRNQVALAVALAAAAALTACTGGGAPPFAGAGSGFQAPQLDGGLKPPKYLAVSEYSNVIVVLNGSYHELFTISEGLDDPQCVFYDRRGNLYAANPFAKIITEYNLQGQQTFVYSGGFEPGCVTADRSGNVYVNGFNSQTQTSVIAEYRQRGIAPVTSCQVTFEAAGIAVDSKGDVFVTGRHGTGPGRFFEYKGGLRGCRARLLRFLTLSFPGGFRIDRHDDLVAADMDCCVEIIAPPYRSITSIITGAQLPVDVALSESNSLIFILDLEGKGDILVATYPTGKILTTLGSSNGLYSPQGLATYPYLDD
ncbi:MAG: hypothetical protein JO104_07930 [Candidatus Eremiobacteraeota bacterium]|nr:hypothetical protein [Candidatus Eremiobacteraeota bacterium]